VLAATTRASVRGLVPPTRSNSLLSTRSGATCMCRQLADSSRKIVPPAASSKRPRLRSMAPVNAPRSCPNSSEPIRPPGRAAQFT
jgi:hypothetical protein